MRRFPGRGLVLFLLTSACACGQSGGDAKPVGSERRGAPPPTATVAASGSACAPSAPDDAPTKGFFPERVGELCLQKDATSYGKDAKSPISGICDLFDGECQLYLDLAIERAVEVRYASLANATITIRLSRFDSAEHAYAMFTTRVVGDFDPAVDAPRPLDVGDGAVDGKGAGLGVGNALFVKGPWLFEADYKDSALGADALKKVADVALPELAKKVFAALPAGALPDLAAAVPSAERVPLGVRYHAVDGLGVKGAGPAMLGYHRTSDGRRYRTFVSKSADAGKATRVFQAFSAKALDPVGAKEEVARVELKEGALALEWVFAVKGEWVVGVGDESRVLRAGVTGAPHDDLCLPVDKKKQLVAEWIKSL